MSLYSSFFIPAGVIDVDALDIVFTSWQDGQLNEGGDVQESLTELIQLMDGISNTLVVEEKYGHVRPPLEAWEQAYEAIHGFAQDFQPAMSVAEACEEVLRIASDQSNQAEAIKLTCCRRLCKVRLLGLKPLRQDYFLGFDRGADRDGGFSGGTEEDGGWDYASPPFWLPLFSELSSIHQDSLLDQLQSTAFRLKQAELGE